jgi:hydrogenase maturation factor
VASPLLASYQLPEYIITTDIESDPDGNIYIAGYNADAFAHLLNSTWIYPQNDFIAKISYSSGLVFDWVYVPFNSAKTLNYDYLGDGALSLGTFKQGSTDYIIISSGTALDILDNTGAQTSLNHTYSINTSYTDRTNRIAVDRLNSRLYYLDNSYLPTMPLYAEINCLDFSTTSPFFSVNSARPTKIVLTTGSQQMGLSYDLKVDNTLGGTGNIYVVKGDEIISISGSSWNINGTPSWSRETFMPSTTQASASTYSRTFTDPDMSALDRCLTFDDNLVSNGNIYIGGIATNINQLYLNSTLTPPFLPAVTGSSETSYGFIIRLDNANGAFYKTNSGETDIMRVDISDNPWVSIFPNPTKDQLNIAFNVLSKNATVSIYDMTGRIVIDKTMDISGGKSQAIDLSDMADGTYEVHVRSGSNVAVKKVVKIH